MVPPWKEQARQIGPTARLHEFGLEGPRPAKQYLCLGLQIYVTPACRSCGSLRVRNRFRVVPANAARPSNTDNVVRSSSPAFATTCFIAVG